MHRARTQWAASSSAAYSAACCQNIGEHVGAVRNNRDFQILLRIVPVRVFGDNGHSVTTYGLLDNRASMSNMSRSLAESLHLNGRRIHVPFNTVIAQQRWTPVELVHCTIGHIHDSSVRIRLRSVHVLNEFNIDMKYRYQTGDIEEREHLRDLPIPPNVNINEITIIIGEDSDAARTIAEQPFGLRTPLGWVIAGPK